MSAANPFDHAWWLASRASGILALSAMSFSVILGLLLGGKLVQRAPADRDGRKLTTPLIVTRTHEFASIAALVAIAVHGLTLVGDAYLHPSLSQIAVPFTIAYRPFWTALGIVGGYAAVILGLSYYARKRIGNDRWRRIHRFTLVAFLLSVVHTLGAGTDAGQAWLLWPVLSVSGIVLLLLIVRVASATSGSSASNKKTRPRAPASAERERVPASVTADRNDAARDARRRARAHARATAR